MSIRLRSEISGVTLKTLVVFGAVIVFAHSTVVQVQAAGNVSADSAGLDYCLELHSGANLISFYGLPEDVSVANVMSSSQGVVTKIIGEGVAASYVEGTGWTGSLTSINPRSGYWVHTNDATSLCLTGAIPTDPGIAYQLHAGSNLVSFPYHGAVDIGAALPDDVENVITEIIGEGVAANKSAEHGWLGSLTSFEGGKGYWIETSAAAVLVFNVPEPSGLLLILVGCFAVTSQRRRAQ